MGIVVPSARDRRRSGVGSVTASSSSTAGAGERTLVRRSAISSPIAPRNLVNLKSVTQGYGSHTVLRDVTLGLNEGERVGVVGDNGAGKSTLARLIAGVHPADGGAVTRTTGLRTVLVSQRDELEAHRTAGQALLGDASEQTLRRDAAVRGVLAGLLGGPELTALPQGLDTRVATLSGGERRRLMLARALISGPELLVLDEPTNHLDIEGIAWLAAHLTARPGTVLVITHDRWFLDAVCDATWEVADGAVHRYEGGYSAYVLARAERDRQAAAREDRRQALVRKELAWLRRGPPARTSKPTFRVEAANALIADVPPPRNTVELLRFAAARLGDRVLELEDATVALSDRRLLDDVTWRLGPGERIGIVGPNGAGKTTLLRVLAGDQPLDAGERHRGTTVQLAQLTQETGDLPPGRRVVEALAEIRGAARTSGGEELTAGTLAERFGFRGERLAARTEDLSGGERRRLALMRLLLAEPNVLLLDEPTNDLDVGTLTALEDLLDGWPGTLVVVSHDRFFLERVCDSVFGLLGDGRVRHLPGGVDQYLTLRAGQPASLPQRSDTDGSKDGPTPGARRRAAQRELSRIERELDRATDREGQIQTAMVQAATDPARLQELSGELAAATEQRERLEADWLELSEELETTAGGQ